MNDVNSVMSAREKARSFLAQGKTVIAAGLMLKLDRDTARRRKPYAAGGHLHEQGLFDHAKALYLRVVKDGAEPL